MFWGLILKANKKYSQTLKSSFHLSQASLDETASTDEAVQVMYIQDENAYLLCTLQKNKIKQCALDLNFSEGSKVCFSTKGNGIVHLTGYLIPDEFGMDDEDLDEEEEDMEMEETEEVDDLRKKLKEKKNKGEEKKDAKKTKVTVPAVPEEDDSDEDDDDYEEGEEEEDDSDENDESMKEENAKPAEEDDDDDDEDDDDDDEEEDDSDEEEDESDEEVEEPKPKQIKLDKGSDKKKQQNQKPQENGLQNGKAKEKDAKKDKKEVKDKENKEQQQKQGPGKMQKLQGGLQFSDLKVGNGNEAKPGKKIAVFYEGRLQSNNKMFDSTKQGPGFKFVLGRNEVIRGWDLGLVGMKVGGKRKLIIPASLAYGAKGSPPVIPPNSTLIFDVELKNVF